MTVDRLEVVGIPAGGWSELGESVRRLIADAEVLIGGRRHLDLVADAAPEAERLTWPNPLKPGLMTLLERVGSRRAVVLASGDPLVSGIGFHLDRAARAGPGSHSSCGLIGRPRPSADGLVE